MNNKSIPQAERSEKLNDILKSIRELTDQPAGKLINFCRKEGYKDTEIARVLGVSRQALSQKYPKGESNRE